MRNFVGFYVSKICDSSGLLLGFVKPRKDEIMESSLRDSAICVELPQPRHCET